MNKCYYCEYTGANVNHVAHVHIGGQGDVEYPCCDDKVACTNRVQKGVPMKQSARVVEG